MITREELETLRHAHAASTPGEWRTGEGKECDCFAGSYAVIADVPSDTSDREDGLTPKIILTANHNFRMEAEADALFCEVAHAVTPAMIETIEVLLAENERLRRRLAAATTSAPGTEAPALCTIAPACDHGISGGCTLRCACGHTCRWHNHRDGCTDDVAAEDSRTLTKCDCNGFTSQSGEG